MMMTGLDLGLQIGCAPQLSASQLFQARLYQKCLGDSPGFWKTSTAKAQVLCGSGVGRNSVPAEDLGAGL